MAFKKAGIMPVEQNEGSNVSAVDIELISSTQQNHAIKIEEIEDAQTSREILLKMDAIEDIRNAQRRQQTRTCQTLGTKVRKASSHYYPNARKGI